MELTNEFTVNVPVHRAWTVLTDLERIAPCMPGAQLEEIEGDEFRGNIKIKVGPITSQYKGKATFLERDEVARKVRIKAEGRDTKGQGNASALITATMAEAGEGSTTVVVHTDLTITGKVAQFGRGVLVDVSAKILKQFVDCLEHDVLVKPEETLANVAAASAAVAAPIAAAGVVADVVASDAEPRVPPSSAAATDVPAPEPAKPTVRKIEYKEAKPVDLLETAGTPVLKRAAPAAIALMILLFLLRRLRK
jgi:uncharacterized protein